MLGKHSTQHYFGLSSDRLFFAWKKPADTPQRLRLRTLIEQLHRYDRFFK